MTETEYVYLVAYKLPAEDEDHHVFRSTRTEGIAQNILESDYGSLYSILRNLKSLSIATSTVLINHPGDAEKLLNIILNSLDEKIRNRITIYVTKVSIDHHHNLPCLDK